MFPSSSSLSSTENHAAGGSRANLGSFVHSTPLASSPHDPAVSLASNCIREAFGPAVQLVADALQSRGSSSTLRNLVEYIQAKTPKTVPRQGMPLPSKTGNNSCPTELPSIRASLLVLIQHSIVSIRVKRQKAKQLEYSYIYHPDRARYLQRYARYMDYIKKAMDVTAACLINTLLLAGRLRTIDVVLHTVAQHAEQLPKSDKYTTRQTVVDAFCKLVNGGFVEQVRQLTAEGNENPQDEDDGEAEFDEPPIKRVKIEEPHDTSASKFISPSYGDEDPAVVSLLNSHSHYKATLPGDAVWRVRIEMFHHSMRAFHLGRLVAERFSHKIQSAGSLVTAALKYRAHCQHVHAGRDEVAAAPPDLTSFSPQDIVKFLPKPVLQLMEKKLGGVSLNLSKSWKELSNVRQPEVVGRVGEDRYEIANTSLVEYLRERIIHQIINDRHGEVAARIVTILCKHGWLESDALANLAMVPAKDCRANLHQLYKSQYIDLFQLSTSRQYNPANIIYMWRVQKHRLFRNATENVTTALLNIRLRRQHQVEVGKEWIERAQQAEETDENDHETDRLNYQNFCVGMERLDCAAQQLDETLMVLKDYC